MMTIQITDHVYEMLKQSPTGVICRRELVTDNGTYISGIHFTADAANREAMNLALAGGWKPNNPPRWWQWWREDRAVYALWEQLGRPTITQQEE